MSNAENFHFNLVSHAIFGFLIPTAFGGLCYFLAGIAARFFSPIPRQIYIIRLIFFLTLIVASWSYYLFLVARASQGNQLDPNYWFSVARREGTFYGAFTIFGWLIVALINRPKAMPIQKCAERST